MEGTEFAVQLAQFSSLEQLTNLNTEIKTQGVNQLTLGYAQSVNMIGKEVIAQNGNIITVDGDTASLSYNLDSEAQAVSVSIYDQNGQLVKTIDASGKAAGVNTITWNCSDVAPGQYTFAVSATDSSGNSVSTSSMQSGKVTAVHFKNNAITLTVNGQEIALSDVVSTKE
jgi:flagellar basal-body rod modification protein FlgD